MHSNSAHTPTHTRTHTHSHTYQWQETRVPSAARTTRSVFMTFHFWTLRVVTFYFPWVLPCVPTILKFAFVAKVHTGYILVENQPCHIFESIQVWACTKKCTSYTSLLRHHFNSRPAFNNKRRSLSGISAKYIQSGILCFPTLLGFIRCLHFAFTTICTCLRVHMHILGLRTPTCLEASSQRPSPACWAWRLASDIACWFYRVLTCLSSCLPHRLHMYSCVYMRILRSRTPTSVEAS
jgi:hypothetical protein